MTRNFILSSLSFFAFPAAQEGRSSPVVSQGGVSSGIPRIGPYVTEPCYTTLEDEEIVYPSGLLLAAIALALCLAV